MTNIVLKSPSKFLNLCLKKVVRFSNLLNYFSYPTFTVKIRSTSMTIPNSNCENQTSIGDFITVMVIDISLDLYQKLHISSSLKLQLILNKFWNRSQLHAWNHQTNFIRLMGNSMFFMRSFDVKNWFVEICQ